MSKAGSKAEFLLAFTGIRAAAAFLVYLSHFNLPSQIFGELIHDLSGELYIGVTIFFVLSGFLITYRYIDKCIPTRQFFLNYFKNRFARIYPLFFILTTLTFLYFWLSPGLPPEQPEHLTSSSVYLLNITLSKGFFDDFKFSGIAQGWTLTVEECFYALAPIIYLLRKKLPFPIQALVFYFIGAALVYYFSCKSFGGFFHNYTFMFVCTFFGRCFEFYAGIQLAIWFKRAPKTLNGSMVFTYGGMLFILISIILLYLLRDDKSQYNLGLYSTSGMFVNNLVLPIGVMLFFWGILKEETFVRKLLETGLFQLLGKSSYAFYLIHIGVIATLIRQYLFNNYILDFLSMNLIAIILYKFIEDPLNKLIKRLGNTSNERSFH